MSPSEKPKHVVFMVPSCHESLELADRGSAETHVLKDTVRELVVKRSVDPEKLRLNIEQCMSQVGEILPRLDRK